MKAMIFAAGLGTRLKPITDHCPKALVKVGGKPMLQHTIEHLKRYGVNEIIVNIHYLGQQIVDFLQQQNNFGISISISDETTKVLETGGGLWNARDFFKDTQPFLVCNADVLTDIDLQKFYNKHISSNAIATLAVRHRSSSRYLLFDEKEFLCGWRNVKKMEEKIPRKTSSGKLQELAFSGYQFLAPEIFKTCKREGVFSMIDWYLDICATHRIQSYLHNEDSWIDIGSPEQLEQANQLFNSIH